ncbi:MAG: peptidylprolyl isomerase [Planctomycetaceae bacterium]|nr:peptidylprolyl isomerase [Planctomycetaceae bacterium]
MIRRTLNRFFAAQSLSRAARKRRTPRRSELPVSESLECRALLTGNVNVMMAGSDVLVYGDSQDNSIAIVAEEGNVIVRGMAGTTINGSDNAMTLISGSLQLPHSLVASLSSGNDTVRIEGVSIAKDAVILPGSGSDQVGIVGSTIGRSLIVTDVNGNDALSIQNSSIGFDAAITLAGSTGTIDLFQSTVSHNLFLVTGSGEDNIVVDESNIGRDLVAVTGLGHDDLALRSSGIGHHTTVISGPGADTVTIDSSDLTGRSWLFLEGGEDYVLVRGESILWDRMTVFGGTSADIIEIEPTVGVARLKTHSTYQTLVPDIVATVRVDDSTTGVYAVAGAVRNSFLKTLTIELSQSSVAEGAGLDASTLTVTRSGSTAQDLVVELASSNTDKATLPATVTIPAGSVSATIGVSAVNNDIDDPDAEVTLTASSSGFVSSTAALTVTNDDTATLSLAPASNTLPENASTDSLQLTVTRSLADLSQPLTVDLNSDNSNRLIAPASVTIAAGETSAVFFVNPLDNQFVDGNASVTVTASASGFATATAAISVTDDDVARLSAVVDLASISEASPAPATLTISRNTDTTEALEVSITLNETTRLSVPSLATIAAGDTSVQVSLTPIDNDVQDGNVSVGIMVSATDFLSASTAISVADDETLNNAFTLTTDLSEVAESAGEGSLKGTVEFNQVSAIDRTVSLNYSTSDLTGPGSVVVPAGQTTAQFDLSPVDNSTPNGNIEVTITGSTPNAVNRQTIVTLLDDDNLTITAAAQASSSSSTSDLVASNSTVITRQDMIGISGITVPGSVVDIDTNGDGNFDDGTAAVGADGTFSIDVSLTHDATNHGENSIIVRTTLGNKSQTAAVNAHMAVGTVVRFTSSQGTFDIELLDDDAGETVDNFLAYANANAWDNLIVHRSVSNFIIQGGEYTSNGGGDLSLVNSNPSITNQFNAANSNLRGTLSMALIPGNADSGTNQWFINVKDNAALDGDLHTVFGRVIGDGMAVVDAINALGTFNLGDIYDDIALTEVPLTSFNPTNQSLSGTVALTTNSDILVGTGTQFTTELQVGDSIQAFGLLYFVKSIESDTSLTLTYTSTVTVSEIPAKRDVAPLEDAFVVFSDISTILDLL